MNGRLLDWNFIPGVGATADKRHPRRIEAEASLKLAVHVKEFIDFVHSNFRPDHSPRSSGIVFELSGASELTG